MNRIDYNGSQSPQNPITLMFRMYQSILPEVKLQLASWNKMAEQIPDQELREQALASIKTKAFHCQGGAVYAAARLDLRHILIPLIVAFQTISDYLDNLCDRSTSLDPQDFRQLHQAMLDAVNPAASLKNYYAYRSEQDDGGYLHQLVLRCQSCICLLTSYEVVQPKVTELVSLYCDLQVYKHIHKQKREAALMQWWKQHQAAFPHLHWNEFAAATGSTLGVFMLFTAAGSQLNAAMSADIVQVYFPHICCLHIMLDYLIDQEEDRVGGDLNFCHYYEDDQQTVERIKLIVRHARKDIEVMADRRFHRMIIEGLLALYLSDPKVRDQPQVRLMVKQLMRNSPATRLFFWLNSIWIRRKG